MGAPLCLPQWSQICQTECYPCDRIEALPMCPVGQYQEISIMQETVSWADPAQAVPTGLIVRGGPYSEVGTRMQLFLSLTRLLLTILIRISTERPLMRYSGLLGC